MVEVLEQAQSRDEGCLLTCTMLGVVAGTDAHLLRVLLFFIAHKVP